MAIQFEFYKNPQPEKEGEEPSYHPRVVNFQHVTTQRLAKEIHMATTFGKAEVEAMLMELSRCMGQSSARRRKSTSGRDRVFSNHVASRRTHTLTYYPCRQSETKIHQLPGRQRLEKFVYGHTPAAFEI